MLNGKNIGALIEKYDPKNIIKSTRELEPVSKPPKVTLTD